MAGDMCENVPILCCIISFLQLHGDQYVDCIQTCAVLPEDCVSDAHELLA